MFGDGCQGSLECFKRFVPSLMAVRKRRAAYTCELVHQDTGCVAFIERFEQAALVEHLCFDPSLGIEREVRPHSVEDLRKDIFLQLLLQPPVLFAVPDRHGPVEKKTAATRAAVSSARSI